MYKTHDEWKELVEQLNIKQPHIGTSLFMELYKDYVELLDNYTDVVKEIEDMSNCVNGKK